MSRALLFLCVFLPGCVCVTSYPPNGCKPCGMQMQVFTTRPPGEVLTRAECEKLCEPAWCGQKPSEGKLGCRLLSERQLVCDPVDPSCEPPRCGPSTCTGCCDGDGRCLNNLGACGGRTCSDCSADTCNSTTCGALLTCGGRLEAMPRWAACDGVDGGFQQPASSNQDCQDACRASDAGSVTACARLVTNCDDAGTAFTARCGVDAGAPSTCISACEAARVQCEDACPLDSSQNCARCAKDCGLAYGRCTSACP
jgi:hypothetical protein